MKKTILITGGSGFIGTRLVSKLSANKHNKLIILDNFSREKKYTFENTKNIKVVKSDIRKKIPKISQKIDEIYHLAFINGTSNFYTHPKDVMDVGVKGLFNILEFTKKKRIKKFILASSSEVYQTPKKIPTSEKETYKIPDLYNPRYSYGLGKIFSEYYSHYFLKNTKTKLIIFRPHNVFGENMGSKHVIPELLQKIFLNSNRFKSRICDIKIFGSGKETRAFCYVDDAIDQIIFLSKKGKNNHVYNIGQQKEITILSLIKVISKLINIKINVKKSRAHKGSTSRRCPDLKKIKKLGFKVKDNFSSGLNKTINWYLEYLIK